MCQSVNLSRKIVAQNAGCVFAYLCGIHKNDFWLYVHIFTCCVFGSGSKLMNFSNSCRLLSTHLI